jgi:hypothetical protein
MVRRTKRSYALKCGLFVETGDRVYECGLQSLVTVEGWK